jgi:uncharacterized phiE125 gp8 family phage protein
MNPILVEGPAVEPVSLPEMKEHLRVDHDAEDALIEGLVRAARLMVEAASRRLLVAQTWRVFLDRWPGGGTVLLPLSPLIAVAGITVVDPSGADIPIPPERIDADGLSDPPRITVADPPPSGRPRNGITITLRAGYGATAEDVPATLRLAIKIVVARWFENRGDIAGEQTLPPDALALIAPFRRTRL